MKILFIFLLVFLFSCASEEETEKCDKGEVYNNNYNICVNYPCKEGAVKHQCYCRDCDLYWEPTDTFSVCPNCGKKIVAKTCIMRVE